MSVLLIKSVIGAVLEFSDKASFCSNHSVGVGWGDNTNVSTCLCSDKTTDLRVVMFCALACSWQDCR